FLSKGFCFALRLGAALSGPCDARFAQSVFPTSQRKQTCQRHVCSVGRSGYAARREPYGCIRSSAAPGRQNSARLFITLNKWYYYEIILFVLLEIYENCNNLHRRGILLRKSR